MIGSIFRLGIALSAAGYVLADAFNIHSFVQVYALIACMGPLFWIPLFSIFAVALFAASEQSRL